MQGQGVSAGIGMGKVVILKENDLQVKEEKIENVEKEIEIFKKALNDQINEIDELLKKITGTEKEIMQAYLMILKDPVLSNEIISIIKNEKYNAAYGTEKGFNSKLFQVFFRLDPALFPIVKMTGVPLQRGAVRRRKLPGVSRPNPAVGKSFPQFLQQTGICRNRVHGHAQDQVCITHPDSHIPGTAVVKFLPGYMNHTAVLYSLHILRVKIRLFRVDNQNPVREDGLPHKPPDQFAEGLSGFIGGNDHRNG